MRILAIPYLPSLLIYYCMLIKINSYAKWYNLLASLSQSLEPQKLQDVNDIVAIVTLSPFKRYQ